MTYLSNYTTLIGSGSTNTSPWWFVGDFRMLTVSWTSTASLGPSRISVQASNDDGFASSLPTATTAASLYSGINMVGQTPGAVGFENVGFRWLRLAVAPYSSASGMTAVVTGVRH